MARVVFDLDGTLIDSAHDIRASANATLGELGAEPLTEAESRRFIGNGAAVYIARMRAARGLSDDLQAPLLQKFLNHYQDAHTHTKLYPGAGQALTTLKAQGHRLGLCTNKPLRPTQSVLTHLKLNDIFDVIIGGDSLTVRKPDPAPLEASFEALGQGMQIFVGDSEVDAETALNAQVPFLLHSQGYHRGPLREIPHHAMFDTFDELPNLVAGMS